jgi:membrane protein
MIEKALNYLRADIWRVRLRDMPRRRSFLIRQVRVVLLALRGFDEDKCRLRASGLTFYTLMSIVPVVAMAFGIAKGFGFQDALEQKITSMVRRGESAPSAQVVPAAEATPPVDELGTVSLQAGASPELEATLAQAVSPETSEASFQEEAVMRVIVFSNRLLENTSGGLIAGIGVALLFWAVIKLLTQIEQAFNEIWGIKKPRGYTRRISDYLSFMLICPVLFLMASSATVLVASQIEAVVDHLAFLGPLGDLILLILRLLPFAVIWTLFTFMYLVMPNGKVHFLSGLLGGIAAGTLFVFSQWVYVHFQIGVARYGAIYGSFAALPLFLIWLQVSWLIVLLGAEISFAHQNVDTYEFEPDCLGVRHDLKRQITLAIVQRCVARLRAAEEPSTAEEISHALEIPARLVNQILFELVEARVLSEVLRNGEEEPAHQPAQDIEGLTIQGVIDLLETKGHGRVPFLRSEKMEKIEARLGELRRVAGESAANVKLSDL